MMNPLVLTILFWGSKKRRGIEQERSLVGQYLNGNASVGKILHKRISDLVDRGMQTLSARGSHFRHPQDVKQDIIISIMVQDNGAVLRKFEGKSQLSTYLWSVIRFKLIDHLRREMLDAGRKEKLPEDVAGEEEENTAEVFELINRFLEHLSPKDALILRLRWLDQLNYEAICEETMRRGLKVDKTYIGNLLFKMRKELLEFLKTNDYKIDI